MYLILHRSTHRSRYRSMPRSILSRYMVDMSTECQQSIDQDSVDNKPLYWPTYRPICLYTHVDRYSWYFTDTSRILYRHFIVASLSISVDTSAATWSIPRSLFYRYDILPTHRQRPIYSGPISRLIPNEYQSMPQSILYWQRTAIITTKYAWALFVLGSELFFQEGSSRKTVSLLSFKYFYTRLHLGDLLFCRYSKY